MTETTLNANNYIDICSIPSKFKMCMHERMKNIYAQNQPSIHFSCLWKSVHNRTFLNGPCMVCTRVFILIRCNDVVNILRKFKNLSPMAVQLRAIGQTVSDCQSNLLQADWTSASPFKYERNILECTCNIIQKYFYNVLTCTSKHHF